MKLGMGTEESFRIHLGVDLCRGDVGVPKHFLNRPEISPPTEQVCSKTVAQDVRLHPVCTNTCPLSINFDPVPNRLTAQWLAPLAQE